MKLRVGGRFIEGRGGPLAIVVFAPPADRQCWFGVLHVPAAFEEMNKSRRMAALQARAFARMGAMVVLLDPRGTGDSAGEHADATWAGWRDDVLSAWEWLGSETQAPRVLWGSRLGALLAAEIASSGAISPAALVLWQPATSGRTFFNQFLRVAAAQQMTSANGSGPTMQAVRSTLEAGSPVEIAGYDVHPELFLAASAVQMAELVAPRCAIVWRETTSSEQASVTPAANEVVQAWKSRNATIDIDVVTGPSFWATQEIAEAPALIEATCTSLSAMVSAATPEPSS